MIKFLFTYLIFISSFSDVYSQLTIAFDVIDIPATGKVHVWFPKMNNKDDSETYHTYLSAQELYHLSENKEPKIEHFLEEYFREFIFSRQIDFSSVLGVPIAAYKSELKLDYYYPLVIYAPGFRGLSFENSLLCETLAKAGNVVAVIPSVGIDRGVDSASLEYQVQLIIDTKEHLIKNYSINDTRVTLMGFSFGGLSSLLVAMRDSTIASYVSLDGSIRYMYTLAKKMKGFNPEKFSIPSLLFSAEGDEEVDFLFFKQLKKGPFYLIKVNGFNHLDFLSYRFLNTYYRNQSKSELHFAMLDAIEQFVIQGSKEVIIDAVYLRSRFPSSAVYTR